MNAERWRRDREDWIRILLVLPQLHAGACSSDLLSSAHHSAKHSAREKSSRNGHPSTLHSPLTIAALPLHVLCGKLSLVAAPWNIVPLVTKPRFSGIGMVLMRAAIQLSVDEGFHGRLGLHALPQSESFYRDKCGMVPCGGGPHYQNLPYYEMTREQADKFTSN